jgi:hypothetical protein
MRSAKIARQAIMDVRSRNGGVAGADGDLVKIRDHIADRVETLNRGLLVRIDFRQPIRLWRAPRFLPSSERTSHPNTG